MKEAVNKNYKNGSDDNIYEHPLFSLKDLQILIFYLVIAPLSWIAPERIWRLLSILIGYFVAVLHIHRTLSRTAEILKVCGKTWKNLRYSLIEIQIVSGAIEPHFQYLREYRPGAWKKPIKLTGQMHITKALESGNGCILWVCPFLYGSLVEKKGLYQAGFAIHHLGSYAHGPSRSRFGFRFLNPIWTAIEKRYVAELIKISRRKNFAYLRRIEQQLRKNSLVSITCEPNFEQKRLQASILNGDIDLATGAPSFALATKAALLPLFTIRDKQGGFEIIVEPPLELPKAKNRHEAVEILIREYTKLLESYLIRYPDLSHLWRSIKSYPD
jgi:lauroyl/myristoyl acyltransferase